MGELQDPQIQVYYMWVFRNVIGTTLIFDGWNPTHKNGDEWKMIYGIAISTYYILGHMLWPVISFGFPLILHGSQDLSQNPLVPWSLGPLVHFPRASNM